MGQMRHCILFFGDSLQWLLLNCSQFSVKVPCLILAGALEHEVNKKSPIGGMMIQSDELIFFRGVGGSTTNQDSSGSPFPVPDGEFPGSPSRECQVSSKKPCVVAGCCTSYSKSSDVRTPAEPIDGFGTLYNWLVVWNIFSFSIHLGKL